MLSMKLLIRKDKSLSIDEVDKLQEQAIDVVREERRIVRNGEKPSKEEMLERKRDNRFYLPVLNINKPNHWDSLPKSERKHFTDEVAMDTCLSNCCGVSGLKSGCCNLDPDDLEHILGPVKEDWIKEVMRFFTKKTGLKYTRHDFVIDFEEGKKIGDKFFKSHEVFMSEASYPMLRFKVNGLRFSCNFLNVQTGMCTIYPIRPDMCKNYYCQYLKKNFLIKDPNHPSKWIAFDKEV